jgi:hypothetical protein
LALQLLTQHTNNKELLLLLLLLGCSCIYLEGLKKVTKILNKDSRCPGTNSYPRLPEQEPGMLTSRAQRCTRLVVICESVTGGDCALRVSTCRCEPSARRCVSRSPHCLTQLFNSIYKTCSCFATVPYWRLSLELAPKPCQKHVVAGG